jgi:hypothetical protein
MLMASARNRDPGAHFLSLSPPLTRELHSLAGWSQRDVELVITAVKAPVGINRFEFDLPPDWFEAGETHRELILSRLGGE